MKRHLLWVLMVASLCAGCAASPVSEVRVLASDIARGEPTNVSCMPGDVRYCEVDVVDRQKHCACIDSRALHSPR
jgi:hypothetical protein